MSSADPNPVASAVPAAVTSSVRSGPDLAPSDATARAAAVVDAVTVQFLGRRQAVELALACILADGHLLIEDAPKRQDIAVGGAGDGAGAGFPARAMHQ